MQIFKVKEKGSSLIFGLFKVYLFKLTAIQNPNVFLHSGDVLSYEPLFFNRYEYGIASFLKYLSMNGYHDALIDIGANIGLSSIYLSESFNVIHCFEPHPVVFHVLMANAFPYRNNIYCTNVGIASKACHAVLTVPKNNLGGGFINDDDNSLSQKELANKDGWDSLNSSFYNNYEVRLDRGSNTILPIFKSLRDDAQLVIKIDVEGYEQHVLKEISENLLVNQKVIIIFENFSHGLTIDSLKKIFTRDVEVNMLCDNLSSSSMPKLFKLFKVLISGRLYFLDKNPQSLIGQVVLSVS